MFKKLFHKHAPGKTPAAQGNMPKNKLKAEDLDPRVVIHYGIPSTASTLAFDSIQRLLAVATLDGRIKIIGSDNIECLLVSPKQLAFKYLEFLQNQGLLVSISNENDIQVWDLKHRDITSTLHWECNVTSFSVMFGTQYMYIGDEQGVVSVMKYDILEGKVVQLPYSLPPDFVSEKAGLQLPDHHSIVGLLSQPGSLGNRLVIAYDHGVIVLWDILEAKVVLVRGNKDVHLMEESVVNISSDTKPDNSDDALNQGHMEKEISSLCWASSNGSVLAVGYVDGDIMLWNFSTSSRNKDHRSVKSSNKVVKLQLASGNRRLPVIVLHWSADVSIKDHGGLLFVYGGDEIGSAEVLSILRLDWSSGLDYLKCLERVDLTLHGSFADMRLLPKAGATERSECTLSILTNPGQLHIYGDIFLSNAKSEQENKAPILSVPFRTVIPTMEPHMTIGQLHSICADVKLIASLSEVVSTAKVRAIPTPVIGSTKWPLTGGIPSPLSANNNQTTQVYIGGYHDGSIRIWDATFSSLLLIYDLQPKLEDIQIEGFTAPVSALEFCSSSLSLVIGNEGGLVRLYTLVDSAGDNMVHLVSEDKREAICSQQKAVHKCTAVFSLLKSSVRTLKFLNTGARVAVGYECGQVGLLDTSTFSVLLLTDVVSSPTSPVISICSRSSTMGSGKCRSLDDSKSDSSNDGDVEKIFLLTKDAKVVVFNSASGSADNTWSVNPDGESNAISMDFIGRTTAELNQFSSSPISIPKHQNPDHEYNQPDDRDSVKAAPPEKKMDSSTVLFSCDNALVLSSLDSLFQKETHYIRKVNLVNPCCWTTVFKTNSGNRGVALLYQTGVIEIRSFPELEIVQECSLMSILRWNFRKNMERTMTSTMSGLLALGNGCEFAIVSLLASENDFRIPESLPCLHDDVIAAAADAAIKFSLDAKKKQDDIPGILGGLIKGIKVGKLEHNVTMMDGYESYIPQFGSIFSRAPGTPPPATVINDGEIVELNIDDIELDEPFIVPSSSSSQGSKNDGKDKEADREKLFEGASNPAPKARTVEEIAAKYRKPEAAAAAAARARERLVERQEKLENLSRKTEELQNGAENFASMAQELAKRMENRSKWWKL